MNQNREIAFRVWNEKKKKYSDFDYAISEEGGLISLEDEPCEYLSNSQSKHLIVQQWTGLQDKNGKDIYEGDIVTGLCFDYRSYCLARVEFYRGKFIAIALAKFIEGPADIDNPNIDVVGNIFENPDLIIP